jgi:ubiquinone/menaquinone biosynthesis C-methylase UbiE
VAHEDEASPGNDDGSWLFEMLVGHNLHVGFFDDAEAEVDPKDRMTDVLIDEIGLGAGQRLLDVGCGPGRPAVRFAGRTGAEVVGITVSEDQVATGTRLAKEFGVADLARFELGDAAALSYPDGSFDGAWAVESLTYVPERATALREISRVLRPGGVLVLSDHVERTELTAVQREVLAIGFTVDRLPTEQHYFRLLADVGLQVAARTDATEHMRRTAGRAERTLAENRDLIAERAGESFAERLLATVPRVIALEQQQLGYVILKARKGVAE